MRLPRLALLLAVPALPAAAQPPAASGVLPNASPNTPRAGAEVLARMRAAYDGRWYRTLTFTQTTTLRRPDGQTRVETWYESLRHTPERGVQLRIDRGDPAEGNGMLYTADSTWVLRGGRVASVRGEGNEFLPLIEGVYVQPVERTARELAPMRVDMARVRADTWAGRPVWVVGAAAGDSTSPQFWVDAERHVLVRMVLAGGEGRPPLAVVLDGYVPVGGGWLATKVTIGAGGTPVQTEEYAGWKADVPLAPALFDVGAWTAAPHWARARR